MQSAKQAANSVLGRSGQANTDVDESVQPAVVNEVVKPSRHEETVQAIDKETHQHHYHTTVQPVTHGETRPEQHTHQVAPQVERSSRQNNPDEDRARVDRELGAYQNTSKTLPASQSASAAQVSGEHTHHHVHEVVQPVIHKETIAPEVVHTTVPVHEKHIAPSEHHGVSTLPTKSMSEFTQSTGQSGSHRHEEYEGHPRPYKQDLMKDPAPVDLEPAKHDGMHDPKTTGHFSSRN